MALLQSKHRFIGNTPRSQKPAKFIRSFLQPCISRNLSEIFTSLRSSAASPPKTAAISSSSFYQFCELPYEIREMIWVIYISFPRVHVLASSSSPTAANPWPLKIAPQPNPHPSLLACHESRSIYQKINWETTLEQMNLRTWVAQSSNSHPHSSTQPHSFISHSSTDVIDWGQDIFWFKDIPTVMKLSAGSFNTRMMGYNDVRRVALDYAVLDYEEDGPAGIRRSGRWRKRFQHGWYGLASVLRLFFNLEEVFFVLEVEGDVDEMDGETAFEEVNTEQRVQRRLEGLDSLPRGETSGLRFPQLDDRAMYPMAALDSQFRHLTRCWDGDLQWKKPNVRFVYAKNVGP